MNPSMRNEMQRKFKKRGFTLEVEALQEILTFVNCFPEEQGIALDILLNELHHSSLKSRILDKKSVQQVASLLLVAVDAVEESPTSCGYGSAASALRIVHAFDFPKLHYDPIKKNFYEHTGKLPIHGDASAKATLYRDRFLLLFQRLSRDPHFSRPVFDTDISDYGSCQISTIQSLVGQKEKRWVMGLISQMEDGHFYLEDLTAAVEIDLSNANNNRIFLENTIVLVEGVLFNGIFQVKTCGFPPLEDREKSVALFSGFDYFGGDSLTKEETLRLAELETGAVKDMFVVLSDVWLDDEETIGNLETVLSGYENEEVVPSLFVFMGNFCSHPCNLSFHAYSSLRLQFGKLGQMIASHQRLKELSRFLFIPGPDDVGPSTALPRCPLPKYVTEELQKYIPNSIFSSNPCRIKFYSQEIVFFRQDILYRMRRACLVAPSEETSDLFEHLVATITHQSHLCPLPLSVQPIIWNYDHCLHLYPTPHTIVLGDRSEKKTFKYAGITCFNPGSFSDDSTFVAYRPCTREVELSAL